jgi:hypothetical protein
LIIAHFLVIAQEFNYHHFQQSQDCFEHVINKVEDVYFLLLIDLENIEREYNIGI